MLLILELGIVAPRSSKVHGNELLSSETKVMIQELVNNDQPHPTYN